MKGCPLSAGGPFGHNALMDQIPFEGQIRRASEYFGLPFCLVAAICKAESSFRPWAWRYEPGFDKRYVRPWARKHLPHASAFELCLLSSSLGLMQVMGLVAVELGQRPKRLTELFIPDAGLWFGCRKLRQLYKRYGRNTEDAVAAYNAGSKRWLDLDRDGVKDANEPYRNERYVRRVMRYMKEFQEMERRGRI